MCRENCAAGGGVGGGEIRTGAAARTREAMAEFARFELPRQGDRGGGRGGVLTPTMSLLRPEGPLPGVRNGVHARHDDPSYAHPAQI